MDEINKTMHDFLTKIIEYDQKLSDISTDYKEFRLKFAEQFQIISSNLDKLAINDFSMDAEIPNFINSLEEDSQKKIIETTELITQKKHVEDQINFFKQNILKLENNIKNLEDEVDKIQKIL
jgi:flagellar biosynthesis chaperone FliJ